MKIIKERSNKLSPNSFYKKLALAELIEIAEDDIGIKFQPLDTVRACDVGKRCKLTDGIWHCETIEQRNRRLEK